MLIAMRRHAYDIVSMVVVTVVTVAAATPIKSLGTPCTDTRSKDNVVGGEREE